MSEAEYLEEVRRGVLEHVTDGHDLLELRRRFSGISNRTRACKLYHKLVSGDLRSELYSHGCAHPLCPVCACWRLTKLVEMAAIASEKYLLVRQLAWLPYYEGLTAEQKSDWEIKNSRRYQGRTLGWAGFFEAGSQESIPAYTRLSFHVLDSPPELTSWGNLPGIRSPVWYDQKRRIGLWAFSFALERISTSEPGQWYAEVLDLVKPTTNAVCDSGEVGVGVLADVVRSQDTKSTHGKTFVFGR